MVRVGRGRAATGHGGAPLPTWFGCLARPSIPAFSLTSRTDTRTVHPCRRRPFHRLARSRLPRQLALAIVAISFGCGGPHASAPREASSDKGAKRDEPRLRAEAEFARALDPRVVPTLEGSWITIGGSRAYLTLPVGVSAPMPGIVVMHTSRGLNRDIQLWTDRLADEGYATIAIDFYHGRSADRREEALALRDEANKRPEANKAIIHGAYDYLASDPRIRATRRALVGWSYGAGWPTLMATQLPDVKAVVAHYGVSDLAPEGVAKIQSPFLLICGDRDEERAEVAAFAASLKTAGKPVQLVWTHADHGFVDPSNTSYDGPAARRVERGGSDRGPLGQRPPRSTLSHLRAARSGAHGAAPHDDGEPPLTPRRRDGPGAPGPRRRWPGAWCSAARGSARVHRATSRARSRAASPRRRDDCHSSRSGRARDRDR